jgi:hypothetical protein
MIKPLVLIFSFLAFAVLSSANNPYSYKVHSAIDIDGIDYQWANIDKDSDGEFDGNYLRYYKESSESYSGWVEACDQCPMLTTSTDEQFKVESDIVEDMDFTIASAEDISFIEDRLGKKSGINRKAQFTLSDIDLTNIKGFSFEDNIIVYDIEGSKANIDSFSAILSKTDGTLIGKAEIKGTKLIYSEDNLPQSDYAFIVYYNGIEIDRMNIYVER